GKWGVYDQGIHVPLIVRWPGVVEPGSATEGMVSHVDLLPTFIAMAGGGPREDLDGSSILPLLNAEARSHRDVIFATHSQDGRMNVFPARTVRGPRYKYILNLSPENRYTTHVDSAPKNDGKIEYFNSWIEAAKSDARVAALLKRYHER